MAGSNVAEILAECALQVNAGTVPRLNIQTLEIGAKLVGEVGTGQRELDRRLEEPELVAGVEAPALELHRVHRAALAEPAQPVGQLDLPATIRRRFGEDI